MRSAQFGVYDSVLSILRKNHQSSSNLPVERILGIFDPHIIIAGFAGTLKNVLSNFLSRSLSFLIISTCLPFFLLLLHFCSLLFDTFWFLFSSFLLYSTVSLLISSIINFALLLSSLFIYFFLFRLLSFMFLLCSPLLADTSTWHQAPSLSMIFMMQITSNHIIFYFVFIFYFLT